MWPPSLQEARPEGWRGGALYLWWRGSRGSQGRMQLGPGCEVPPAFWDPGWDVSTAHCDRKFAPNTDCLAWQVSRAVKSQLACGHPVTVSS